MVKRRLVRFGAIAASSLLALMLSSCVGGLPVTVTSVTGTLQAYNPAIASGGIPSERVDFTVGDYAYGSTSPLVCLIDVYQNDVMVGATLATIGSEAGTATAGGVQESDVVGTSSPSPFNGTPADAKVNCITKA